MMLLLAAFVTAFLALNNVDAAAAPTVVTTSGKLIGVNTNGVNSFKAVPFAQPPVGSLRWKPPVPLVSGKIVNATQLGPSCLQEIAFATQALTIPLYDTPGPPGGESEDCLLLNVWAPAHTRGPKRAAVIWIHGGALAFGTGGLVQYDGQSIAQNQDVIVVTINYRTNIFGFPMSADPNEIPEKNHNLGLLDQELAIAWVRENIVAFGGDPKRISLMGQSAGASSITWILNRHGINPPFQSAVLLSSAFLAEAREVLDSAGWETFATAVGCTGPSGVARLQCLKQVPAATIHDFMNGPSAPATITAFVDNFTVFSDPVQRIQQGKAAHVPILQGSMQDDGTVFVFGETDVAAFLNATSRGLLTPAEVDPLYPGLSGFQEIGQIERDIAFLCPAQLHTSAFVQSGVKDVFRYTYGAVFADLQLFPGLGAYHGSEIEEVFGTFNPQTATPSEVQLSQTMQKGVGNFIKNPFASPLPNWPQFVPSSTTATLAKLAYNNNTAVNNVVQTVPSNSFDATCLALWDQVLLARSA